MLNNARSLSEHVISPTLHYLDDFSEAAKYLLLGTAAVETNLSLFGLSQFGHQDEGVGLFNISPETHTQVWDQYLAFDPDLASKIRGLASQRGFLANPHSELSTNLSYSTAIAWTIYKRSPKQLNQNNNTLYLANYWKEHYRSHCKISAKEDFCKSFNELVIGINDADRRTIQSTIIDAA